MNTIQTDGARNFIRIRLESSIDLAGAFEVIKQVFFQMEMFKGSGFRVLLDIRDAEPFVPEVAEVWIEVAKQARLLGLVKSARLVRSGEMKEVVQRVARAAGNDDIVMDFTDEENAVHWLTHASSRPLS